MPEDNVEVQGGLPVSVGKTGAVSPIGKIALDPTQTSEILRNMQAMIDERTSPLAELSKGLEGASAWAVPSLGGQKAQALATVNEQQSKQAQELFNMRTQMAAYKAAQAQAERFKQRAAGQIGGGAATAGPRGTTEATIPPQVQQEIHVATGIPLTHIYVANADAHDDASGDEPTSDENESPVLDNPDMKTTVGGQEHVGLKKVDSLLKELGRDRNTGTQYKGVNDNILAKSSPDNGKAETTADLPQGKTSPVGSRQNKIPSPVRGKR